MTLQQTLNSIGKALQSARQAGEYIDEALKSGHISCPSTRYAIPLGGLVEALEEAEKELSAKLTRHNTLRYGSGLLRAKISNPALGKTRGVSLNRPDDSHELPWISKTMYDLLLRFLGNAEVLRTDTNFDIDVWNGRKYVLTIVSTK